MKTHLPQKYPQIPPISPEDSIEVMREQVSPLNLYNKDSSWWLWILANCYKAELLLMTSQRMVGDLDKSHCECSEDYPLSCANCWKYKWPMKFVSDIWYLQWDLRTFRVHSVCRAVAIGGTLLQGPSSKTPLTVLSAMLSKDLTLWWLSFSASSLTKCVITLFEQINPFCKAIAYSIDGVID